MATNDTEHFHITLQDSNAISDGAWSRTISANALRATAPPGYGPYGAGWMECAAIELMRREISGGGTPFGASGMRLVVDRCDEDCSAPGRSIDPMSGATIAADAWRRFDNDASGWSVMQLLQDSTGAEPILVIYGRAADHLTTAIVAAADSLVAR
jgi:hypothetical protein